MRRLCFGSNTESSIINSLDNLNRDITVIFIAHRLSTLEKCDRILKIKNGKLISG